ncbi:hypothetical protein M2372_002144 [Chryseobacterium sp. BIGb0232]|nr:hypothetical protein [Chryseobacterium sp. BIGb0232]ROS17354.1 hypothetical protein EDF65_1721 [Chryseobacterium nakagawai]
MKRFFNSKNQFRIIVSQKRYTLLLVLIFLKNED